MSLAGSLLADKSLRAVAQTTVLLLAGWRVWLVTAWQTDVFDPRLPRVQNLVIVAEVGLLSERSADGPPAGVGDIV
jgi:low temperature requirement protein LtrA